MTDFNKVLFIFSIVQYVNRGRLDLAVLFTPSTPNRQNRNQVRWNICAGVRRSTPSSEVVQTEQSRDLFQKRWRITACMRGNDLYRLIYSGVLQSAQCYLFMWLFWCTPSTLNIAKSSPPQVIYKSNMIIALIIEFICTDQSISYLLHCIFKQCFPIFHF